MQTGEASLDVVISYSSSDSKFVDRLESDLKGHHLTTWVDRRKLVGGQVWDAEIRSAIDRCRILLVVISPKALASPWVAQEYQYALKHHKEVIPVRYYPTERLPPELQRLHWVDFLLTMDFEATYPTHLQELLQAIDFHLKHYNASEVARQSEQAKRDKRRGLRLASSVALYTLLILLFGGIITRIFFPLQIVKTIPLLEHFPGFDITLGTWSSNFEPPYAGTFTIYAHVSVPVDNSGYVIQLVDHTDGDHEVQTCTTGSTCSVTLTCPRSAKILEYQAYIDQGNTLSAILTAETFVSCPRLHSALH